MFFSNDVNDDLFFMHNISVFTFEIGYGDPLGRDQSNLNKSTPHILVTVNFGPNLAEKFEF